MLADSTEISDNQLREIEEQAVQRKKVLQEEWDDNVIPINALSQMSLAQTILDTAAVKDRLDKFNIATLAGSKMTKLDAKLGPGGVGDTTGNDADVSDDQDDDCDRDDDQDDDCDRNDEDDRNDHDRNVELRERELLEDESDAAQSRSTSTAMSTEAAIDALQLKFGEHFPFTKSASFRNLYRDYFYGTVSTNDAFECFSDLERCLDQ